MSSWLGSESKSVCFQCRGGLRDLQTVILPLPLGEGGLCSSFLPKSPHLWPPFPMHHLASRGQEDLEWFEGLSLNSTALALRGSSS